MFINSYISQIFLWFKYVKLDDSAFFRTQSYITEICYFEYLLSMLSFELQKKNIFLPSSEQSKN